MDMHIERIIFKGYVYKRDPRSKNTSARNYFKRKSNKGNKYLHREIYIENFGPIPEDNVIHHIDGNPSNNDPTNLQAIHINDHRRTMHKSRLRVTLTEKICIACKEKFGAKQKRSRFCPLCAIDSRNYKKFRGKKGI